MTNLTEMTCELASFFEKHQAVYLRIHGILDPNKKEIIIIDFIGYNDNYQLKIDYKRTQTIWGILKRLLINNVIISWDIKRLFSYLKHYNKSFDFKLMCKIIDLKYCESYSGINNIEPINFKECVERLKLINKNVIDVISKIHIPLAIDVLPKIEANGLLNRSLGKRLFSYYEVEGQVNGRLKAYKAFDNCFNPHTLDKESKSEYIVDYGKIFVNFDYINLEPYILAKLSGDINLNKILNSNRDLYSSIYELLFSKKCENDNHRKLAKIIFIPATYGLSKYALSKNLGINVDESGILLNKLNRCFKEAFDWLDEQQNNFNGIATDCFGRCRSIPLEEKYKVKNFLIQSSASLFCLEMLVKLSENLKGAGDIIYHIHDAYGLLTDEENIQSFISLCSDILQSESKLLPGLNLKVKCNYSKNFDGL